MILVAPASIATLNRITGITNVAAPVAYSVVIAFAGNTLILIFNWRPAPREHTRRITRLCITVTALTIIAVIALFWIGHAPVEQITLFDVYYANTPYIRELIITYLTAQGVAMMAASTLCWRWSKDVRGSLQAGLHILAFAFMVIVCHDGMRLVAVTARWTGHNLDFLVDKVTARSGPPVALLGAIGFTLPLVGPHVTQTARAIWQLRKLTPLWRALRQVPTIGALRASLPWWKTPPAVLLTARKTVLYDAILALTPYYDPVVRKAAYRAALRTDDKFCAAATADAAMVLVARERQRTKSQQLQGTTHSSVRCTQDLVLLSQALTSPVLPGLLSQLMPVKEAAGDE
ncbi:DUF6545 domain-containing protein [Streptomyces klenkii]|uniref:DUF6545 domain-containing protein n=1 Tax=Streptomyces klenkii TaxID=1420899 RepID=UPI0033C4A2C7